MTGDEDLSFEDQRGNTSLLFHFANLTQIPLAVFPHSFVETIWSTARLTVRELDPERVIAANSDRIDSLMDVLERGAAKAAEAEREMHPLNFGIYWPGWG